MPRPQAPEMKIGELVTLALHGLAYVACQTPVRVQLSRQARPLQVAITSNRRSFAQILIFELYGLLDAVALRRSGDCAGCSASFHLPTRLGAGTGRAESEQSRGGRDGFGHKVSKLRMGGRGHGEGHAHGWRHGRDLSDSDLSRGEVRGGRRGFGRGGRGGGRIFGPGDLRLVLLSLIGEQPRHGYELIKAVEDLFGGGYSPSPGSVYPILTLLEEIGQIKVQRRREEALRDHG
jgi:Transcriptional regulator PadR-like family